MAAKVSAIIPVRFDSDRFQGKAMQSLMGKSLLQWVWEGTKQCDALDQVIVATDSEIIEQAARAFGAEVVMTSERCRNGTERCAEVAEKLDSDLIINVQGDEPMINNEALTALIDKMAETEFEMGTLASNFESLEEFRDTNAVKVVCDRNKRALFFSRGTMGLGGYPEEGAQGLYKHIGVYAYRRPYLAEFNEQDPSPLEESEKLEQLRSLYYGARILVVHLKQSLVSVNTPEDLKRVEGIFLEK